MSDPRDDLAALIFDKSGLGEWSATQLADAIHAAGWTPPLIVLRSIDDVAAHWQTAVFTDAPGPYPPLRRSALRLPPITRGLR